MVAASPRARPMVETITTTAGGDQHKRLGPSVCNVSPSTRTPSSDATTGFATVTVGSEAVSAPARNDDC